MTEYTNTLRICCKRHPCRFFLTQTWLYLCIQTQSIPWNCGIRSPTRVICDILLDYFQFGRRIRQRDGPKKFAYYNCFGVSNNNREWHNWSEDLASQSCSCPIPHSTSRYWSFSKATYFAAILKPRELVDLVADKQVLELGSGTGFLGIAVASLQRLYGSEEDVYGCVLTDVNDQVLSRCAHNIQLPCSEFSPSIHQSS